MLQWCNEHDFAGADSQSKQALFLEPILSKLRSLMCRFRGARTSWQHLTGPGGRRCFVCAPGPRLDHQISNCAEAHIIVTSLGHSQGPFSFALCGLTHRSPCPAHLILVGLQPVLHFSLHLGRIDLKHWPHECQVISEPSLIHRSRGDESVSIRSA